MFNYDVDFLRIDYTKCIDGTNLPNCHAGVESLGKFYCRECDSGYIVNNDGKCDRVHLENCVFEGYYKGFTPVSIFPLEKEKFEYLMEYQPSGCLECEAGFVAVGLI